MQANLEVIRNFKGYATQDKPKKQVGNHNVLSCVRLDVCKLNRIIDVGDSWL